MSNSYATNGSRPTSRWKRFVKSNLLTFLTVIGVFGGTTLGLMLKNSSEPWTQREVMYIQYPGDLFLRMLKCLIVPLLVSSITSAIGSLDLSMSKKIAFRAIVYYFTTTICAVVLGIILVSTIRPGSGPNVGSMKDCYPGNQRSVLSTYLPGIYSHQTSFRLPCSSSAPF